MSLTKSLAVVDDEMDLVNLFKEALERMVLMSLPLPTLLKH